MIIIFSQTYVSSHIYFSLSAQGIHLYVREQIGPIFAIWVSVVLFYYFWCNFQDWILDWDVRNLMDLRLIHSAAVYWVPTMCLLSQQIKAFVIQLMGQD